MNPTRIYTRKISGLDYRVWLLMLIICLMCMAFFGYRQVLVKSSHVNCKQLVITVDGDNREIPVCSVNRISIFHLSTTKNKKVRWDFDDGTVLEDAAIVQHRFKQEGLYKVTATVDEHCVYSKNILVRSASATAVSQPTFDIYPDSLKAMAGTQLRFSGVANFPVQSYSWKVLQTNETGSGETVTFSFPFSGKYDVQLTVNGNLTQTKVKTVEIIDEAVPISPYPPLISSQNPEVPKDLLGPGGDPFAAGQAKKTAPGTENLKNEPGPAEKQPDDKKPKNLDVDPETFKGMLQAVLSEEKDIEDLYPYLYYKGETKVEVKNETTNLKVFCKEKRKKKIDQLSFTKDEYGIQRIKVKLEKKGIFGIKL